MRIKPEDLTGDVVLYPDVFARVNDTDVQVECIARNDSLSLKGQIWPGMGKMDLADDDMKRTRNQRKPKSAIERMRRTSEGIEPHQVVMTADFEVERIKGVYDDSSSPIPGQEDAVSALTPFFFTLTNCAADSPKEGAKATTQEGRASHRNFWQYSQGAWPQGKGNKKGEYNQQRRHQPAKGRS